MSIATNLQRLVDAKSDIAEAITAKGGTVNSGDGFEEFPDDIASIPSGSGSKHYTATKPRLKRFLGFPRYFLKEDIWTDGEDIYHNYYDNSGSVRFDYILDKDTNTFVPKKWNGLPINLPFYGKYIWTDGENIYYSSSSTQYVLDKNTSTWSTKSWSNLTSFFGNRIWTDGENIYYSSGSTQYVLNKNTSTWSTKSWSNLTSFYGNRIWTDGKNVYYSESTTQYIIDPEVGTIDTIKYGAFIETVKSNPILN